MPIRVVRSELINNIPCVQHAFFGREGGVSNGQFSGLNVNSKSAPPEEAEQNRNIICSYFGRKRENLIVLNQVHSKIIHIADSMDHKTVQEGDALISTKKGLLIGIQTADCVPILMAYDCENIPVIAAVHAGWRGAVKGIIFETVETMKKLGATPNKISAAIGPCIWQNSYEVGIDVYDAVGETQFFKPGPRQEHWMFDLPGYVISHLKTAGIKNVTPSPNNTFAEAKKYYSYRHNYLNNIKGVGGQLSVIGIKG